MKSLRFSFAGLLVLVGILAFSLSVDSASPPVGSVRCNFTEPAPTNIYQFYDYPQPASYNGSVSVAASGDPAVEGASGAKPVTSFTLKWIAVTETAPYKNEPLKASDGYTAMLSSSLNGNSVPRISGASVPLSGSYDANIGRDDVTYTLDIRKNGATVTTCSVSTTLKVNWKKTVQPTVAGATSVNFPAPGQYSVKTSKGTSTASYKFADPIKDITFSQNNISMYVGNKSVFWIANRYGGGPAGRWNIADPWNPGSSEVMGISSGGSAFAFGAPQPAAHKGPFSSGDWPHPPSMAFGGGSFSDSSTGEGRFIFASGESFDPAWSSRDLRQLTPVLSLSAGQGMSIGQLLETRWQDLFTGAYVTDAAASGKFFFFGAGGTQKNILEIFDVSSLNGSTDRPYLQPISSQPWNNIVELTVMSVPNVRNHFLVARATSGGITAKPLIYVGEINADTGRITRSNSFVLDIQGISYTAPWSSMSEVYPGSNLQGTTVAGGAYVFMNENFTRFDHSPLSSGTLKVAAYKFDSQTLTFTRKGDISFKNMPDYGFADDVDAWKLVNVEGGAAYPLISALKMSSNRSYVNSSGQTVTAPIMFDLNMYALKSFLSSSAPQSVVFENPDVVFPAQIVKRPLTLGQVITVTPEQLNLGGSSYRAFAKTEAGKVNLYLYRTALLFDGRKAGDPVMPYDELPATGSETYFTSNSNQNLGSSFRGVATLRIDKLDVSSFTGAAAGSGATTGTTPTSPGSACSSAYSSLCDQLDQLKRLVCKLNPAADFCPVLLKQ